MAGLQLLQVRGTWGGDGMSARWQRLAETLTERGINHRVVERRYPGGVSTSIHVALPANERVVVADSWWRDNWTGWQVWREDADALCTEYLRRSKRRGEVADAVAKAVSA